MQNIIKITKNSLERATKISRVKFSSRLRQTFPLTSNLHMKAIFQFRRGNLKAPFAASRRDWLSFGRHLFLHNKQPEPGQYRHWMMWRKIPVYKMCSAFLLLWWYWDINKTWIVTRNRCIRCTMKLCRDS